MLLASEDIEAVVGSRSTGLSLPEMIGDRMTVEKRQD
jgi:hypothetical protein